MRPLTAALLLASLAGAGAAADGDDDGREKPPPLAQVMSIPDLTEVCGPCNECMGPEAAKTDPDDAAIIGIKVTSCLKKCAPCVKDFLNVYCTMSPTRVMITQPCCYDLSASVSKRLEEGTASVVKLITKRKGLKPVDAWVEASAPYGVGVTYCWLLAVRIVAVGAVAAVLHVLVEYPFMQFASSLKAPPKKPAAANGAV